MLPRLPVPFLSLFLLLSAGFSHGEEKWTHYFAGNNITDMAIHGDSLWCTTQGSVVLWDTRNQVDTQYLIPHVFPLLTIGSDGVPWYNNNGNTLSLRRFSGTEWIQYPEFDLSNTHDQITSLSGDRTGAVWAGTTLSGAYRFDGTSWRQYSASDELLVAPRAVAVDDSGAVWMGTNDGLYRFYEGNWRRFTTADGLGNNLIRCLLAAPDGTLWAGTSAGASRFDGAVWKTFKTKDGLSSNGINSMTVDRVGSIWLGTDNGISRFDGATWTVWKGDAEYFIDKEVTGIAVDAANRIWMSHRGINNGVTVFDGAQVKWYTTFNTDIPTNTIESVAAGSDGVLWFVTDRGALRYDGVVWKSYSTGDGLASNSVKDVIVDRNNDAWFLYPKTENAGATRLGPDGAVTYSTANGLRDNTVISLAVSGEGTLWIGTSGGISRFDGSFWVHYPDTNRLLSSKIFGIEKDPGGVLWFATGYGLTRFDGVNWRTYMTDEAYSKDISAISPQGNEMVWCMAGVNLMRFSQGVFMVMPAPADSLVPPNFITRIDMDRDGVVWTDADLTGKIVDAHRKILYFDGVGWKSITVPWPSTSSRISDIAVDEHNVKWFATDSGLVRLEGSSATVWSVDGLAGYPIGQMTVDRENVKWFTSLFPAKCSSFDGKDWRDYPDKDKFRGNIAVDSRNRKWFISTSMGLLYLDGGGGSEEKTPPNPYSIRSVYKAVDESDVLWLVFNNADTKMCELGSYNGLEWKMFGNGGLDLNDVSKIVIDLSGTKWILRNAEPVSFDGAEWKTYPDAPFPSDTSWNSVDLAVDRDGTKWFTYGKGVLSFDGKTWRNYTVENSFPYSSAFYVFVDHLNVKWFGTSMNLVSFDGVVWKIHEVGAGIEMGWIASLAVDMENRKWVVWNGGNTLSILDDRPGADIGTTPVSFSLLGNYPNPFNAGTSIAFDLTAWGAVTLSVYDILGRKVRELDAGKFPVGRNVIVWNGSDDHGKRVSSGVYLYRVKFGGALKSGRMMFLK